MRHDIGALIHAAARSPGPDATAERLVADNIDLTRDLLTAARQADLSHVLFLSAVSAYGTVNAARLDETTPVVDPDLYGLSKLVGEHLLVASGVPGLILRLPAVVGPHAHRNWVARAKASIQAGHPLTIYNPNAPFNNIVHMADLAAFLVKVLSRPLRGVDRLVLGADGYTSVLQAVETLMSTLRRSAPVQTAQNGRRSYLIDCRRAMTQYDYRPMEVTAMLRRFATDPD